MIGAALIVVLPMIINVKGGSLFWLMVIVGGIAGYVAPSIYIDKRISARKMQHRLGFPDFMDLLVVCSDSGLSMEASLERIGREMGESYPSLTANIHMTNLEIRAGRPLKDALERFADRLGLEEARQFATLDQPVARSRLQHQRCAARLFRRHAAQAALARRGKGLRAAGQAVGADDGVHFPCAVRRHPAAGLRAPARRPLFLTARSPQIMKRAKPPQN